MAQHDYVIANGTGAATRADLNNGLAAIVSNNSGATEPATMYAYQWWSDTTTGLLKLRNAANSAWVTVGTLASANLGLLASGSTLTAALGSASTPGITFTGDLNTGIYSPGADQVAISTNSSQRLLIDSNGRAGLGATPSAWNSQYKVIDLSEWASVAGEFTTEGSVTLAVNAFANSTGYNNWTARNTQPATRYKQSGGVHSWYTAPSVAAGSALTFTQSMTLDASGRVGIGTTSPGYKLDVYHASNGNGWAFNPGNLTTTNSLYSLKNSGSGLATARHEASDYHFIVGNSEAARLDTSGRLLVGTSTAPTSGSYNQFGRLVVQGNLFSASGNSLLSLNRGEGAATIASGEELGVIVFGDNAGNEFGTIQCVADATAGAGDYPGRLVFFTTADGASSPTERMRISADGTVLIQKTTFGIANEGFQFRPGAGGGLTNNQNPALYLNRLGTDGTIVSIQQDSVEEGSISVSGTTVSYNGAHLSRWSQLPGGAEREEILRGTVLSNIDEMCNWGEEENEQLNRMKVSDVEGDPNVSGVFQAWDDDDDTYTDDFYCAMTGDMIIRIAEGTPVHRGQLLMSAGDGTAKPQDDDIIRSKTIAKVTSNHVTCTYDDGSYCVPCVLMAC